MQTESDQKLLRYGDHFRKQIQKSLETVQDPQFMNVMGYLAFIQSSVELMPVIAKINKSSLE